MMASPEELHIIISIIVSLQVHTSLINTAIGLESLREGTVWQRPPPILLPILNKIDDASSLCCHHPSALLRVYTTSKICSFLFLQNVDGTLLGGLRPQTPGMENLNTPQELDRLKTTVLRQLQTLQGAPSVQMMEVGTVN